ncbi:HlyD family efflux transporter periplasmic adaptor subunit [Clostridium sp. BL-8]|uniref:HlyD family secretion protein n=1 Tax=Clostridium sp. BL-8 TaxID=349938 RepID=UPI00098C51DC|nr:HlyD family efflux transporter periplasmic adaptor subunit [Clostridium sp. BL-8]OOM81152.1 putative multidrug resistance protein EmrK [Clostridium sp. BL-8]
MQGKRKIIIFCIAIAMLITLSGVGFYYWYENEYFVSTEDAQVAGDFIDITPKVSGSILEFSVEEGETLVKDQIVGHIDEEGIADENVNSSLLRAPINGIIIKKEAEEGQYVQAGSTLAVMVDQEKLYITANIEETKVEKLKEGQNVDIKIDQFDGKVFQGKVEYIGKASNSAFSLLPSSSGGTFTKVVQKVPVKIELEENDAKLLPGTNADIKIHIK